MKNLNLGAKLILVGTIVMVIPLFLVAFAAISWSSRGLRAVENVNEVTQTAASAAEEMSAAMAELAGPAQELQQMTS
jgi:hypothetical protein